MLSSARRHWTTSDPNSAFVTAAKFERVAFDKGKLSQLANHLT